MRGTHDSGNVIGVRDRFIPAHAGNSSASSSPARSSTVHPRACGELLNNLPNIQPPSGSSPRMRGTLLNLPRAPERDRFIPAHAGNSAEFQLAADLDHGSSPRMRGTRPRRDAYRPNRRFIPAHAGNSYQFLLGRRMVHGSSPRMRGTQIPREAARTFCRFIPAHAGNSRTSIF